MVNAGVIGQFAAVLPLGPVRLAIGVNPDIAAQTDWHYVDAPGGADGHTTYGDRPDSATILLLRTALGASWQIHPTLSLGANVGLLYNQNSLQTPYVFQTQPTLRTVKTLLDLDTDGFGYNAQVGLRWQPVAPLAFGVSYHHPRAGRYPTAGPPATRASSSPTSVWARPATTSPTTPRSTTSSPSSSARASPGKPTLI